MVLLVWFIGLPLWILLTERRVASCLDCLLYCFCLVILVACGLHYGLLSITVVDLIYLCLDCWAGFFNGVRILLVCACLFALVGLDDCYSYRYDLIVFKFFFVLCCITIRELGLAVL